MAQPFTEEQRSAISRRLFDSACRFALTPGVRKTSLEMLTAGAGISKSSFYKFFESKEALFLHVAAYWESIALERAIESTPRVWERSFFTPLLANSPRMDFVFTVFETIRQLGIERFLREDLPLLREAFPEEAARRHCMNSAANIFARLQQAHIRFTAPDATVRSVIQLMYLSILNSAQIGDSFFPALRELVASACDRLVA